MKTNLDEKILDEKLEIIRRQIEQLEKEYKLAYDYTISRREDLRQERSSLKFNEVSSELKKINKNILRCNAINSKIKKLKISERSPYFASVKFDGEEYFFGKLGVKDEIGQVVINDWRAPIASLYYDFETGPAFYTTPGFGKIEGVIENKKQYKIENSKLVYSFETNVDVVDEILQRTLAENSSDKMKTIVSTIQKEQNKIIRENAGSTLVVQGVAGSGKTSIALHRVAYLLYNNKEFKNKKAFIFSPNKVFSNYISTVLPELGEKKASDTSLEQILNETFGDLVSFRSKFEDIEKFFKDEKYYEDHKIKTSLNFYFSLKEFLNRYFENKITFKTIKIKNLTFEKEKLDEIFTKKFSGTLSEKVEFLTNYLLEFVNIKTPLTADEENSIRHFVFLKILTFISASDKNILKIYSKFLKTQNLSLNKAKLSFDDAVNLLYIKNYIFGAEKKQSAMHLVIDELQDYSPVALDLISQIFDCPKTALGDLYQTVDGELNEKMPEVASEILKSTSEPVKLSTVYRSTKQIAQFASEILNIKNIKFVSRNGSNVQIRKTSNLSSAISSEIENLKQNYKNIAVITKTLKQAADISRQLNIKLLSPVSKRFKTGVIATPAYLSKGLEFDAVIVANASSENYKTELDRQNLYVACTRALHELIILHEKSLTKFIKK